MGTDGLDEQRKSRRDLLRVAGAAAVGTIGAAATGLVTAGPAAASDGDPLLVGRTARVSPGTLDPTVLDVNGAGDLDDTGSHAFVVTDGDPSSDLTAMVAGATNGTTRAGVYGISSTADGIGTAGASNDGIGVAGFSVTGIGVAGYAPASAWSLYAGGQGGIGFDAPVAVGPPPWAAQAGDLAVDSNGADTATTPGYGGNLWMCVVGGPTPTWRKVAGPATAGALHPIDPARVFDSRRADPAVRLGANQEWTVSTALDINGGAVVPVDATAVVFNVTIVDTLGSGYLSVFPADVAWPGTSSINWAGPGAVVANGGTVRVAAASVRIRCGGSGAATHVVLDVTGYYR